MADSSRSVLVVGSVALDQLETPAGARSNALGGSATFISVAASHLVPVVRFVGVVGDDFPEEHIRFLESRGIDLAGLERVSGGKTFSWGGRYHADMNTRDTLFTELGVFATFEPAIPAAWSDSDIVVLGNIQPRLQLHVLDRLRKPRFAVCDTMNLWIETARDELLAVIARVDALILNDQEAVMLSGAPNAVDAGRRLLGLGPRFVVVKKGEHGALLFSEGDVASFPAFPVDRVVDPTGAGDAFAGGFAGKLATVPAIDSAAVRTAVAYGTVLASFAVERFSVDGLRSLSPHDIRARLDGLRAMAAFETA